MLKEKERERKETQIYHVHFALGNSWHILELLSSKVPKMSRFYILEARFPFSGRLSSVNMWARDNAAAALQTPGSELFLSRTTNEASLKINF